jgi:Crinkler effector protein N-terminal domain
MVKLFCALVGEKKSEFAIEVDKNKMVGDLKDAIKQKQMYEFASSTLQLFLAKKGDGTWLDSNTDDVKKLKNGEMNALIKELTHEAKELQGESGLQKVLKGMLEPSTDQIHILVLVPEVDQGHWGEELARKKARTGTTNLFIGPSSADVAKFRDGDKAKHSNKLSSFESVASVGEEEPLKETTFDLPHAFVNTRIDGIALGTEHLKRSILVEKLHFLVSKKSIVLLSSPAASGKSSLLKLYQAASKNIKVIGISFLDRRSPFALLSQKGINFEQKKISKSLANQKVLFLWMTLKTSMMK